MTNLIAAWWSMLWLLFAFMARPSTATCPHDWFVNGIRPSGLFECLRKPHEIEIDCSGPRPCPEGHLPPGELWGQIYCGTQPIVVNEQAVGCQQP